MNENRPTIKIYYSSIIKNFRDFSDLLLGIEEEGIPYEMKASDEESVVELGYKAAQDSRLDVGLGISHGGFVVLHYVKLNRDKPLFKININLEGKKLRALGSNAARLVKGMPFKNLENNDCDISHEDEKGSDEGPDIETIVKEIIKRMGIKA